MKFLPALRRSRDRCIYLLELVLLSMRLVDCEGWWTKGAAKVTKNYQCAQPPWNARKQTSSKSWDVMHD